VLSALGVDLKVVARLMRSGAATDSEQHRANIDLLSDVLRDHVALTSQLVADVKSTGRGRLPARNKRSRPGKSS
jgi:shikimate kinase